MGARRSSRGYVFSHVYDLKAILNRVRLGKPYFYDSTKQIPTVTDSDLMDDDTLHKIEHAYELVLERINGTLLDTDSLNLELLLELDPEDENTCDYYLIDQDSRTLFWLDEGVTTESLHLHPVTSLEHLSQSIFRLTFKWF